MSEPNFLSQMAASSAIRARASRARRAELSARAAAQPAVCPLPAGTSTASPPRFLIFAEHKRTSPSQQAVTAAGPHLATHPDVDPNQAAALELRVQAYVDHGADAISILTEPSRFAGSLEDLEAAARVAASRIPVLRKDFLVDPIQVLEARAFGASGVLLIQELVEPNTLTELVDCAGSLGMFVLLESFGAEALVESATRYGALPHVLLGRNCRNLRTLEVDRAAFGTPNPVARSGVQVLAESGLHTPRDLLQARDNGYTGALIGTTLMRAEDPGAALQSLRRAADAPSTNAAAATP